MLYEVITMILITIFSLFLMLILHFIIIEKKKFFTAFREAIVLLKNRKIKALTSVILWYVLIALSLVLIYSIIILVVSIIVKLFNTPHYYVVVFLSILRIANIIIVFLFSCLAEPLIISIISALFFRLRQENKKRIESHEFYISKNKKYHFINKRIIPIIFVVTFVINILYISSIIKSSVLDDIEMLRLPSVTAHRGSSAFAPENTIKSIEVAIEQMADYAEIDA